MSGLLHRMARTPVPTRLALTEGVKRLAPARLRWSILITRMRARNAVILPRMLPSVLVIGAQRSGTSSLYKYLGEHPDLAPSLRKEVGYFTRFYGQPETWYRSHFPLQLRRHLARSARGHDLVAFEATPDYLLHPLAPERAHRLLPDARIVVLLRDPVERAFSHYGHMVRLGYETLPFEEALAREGERTEDDRRRILADSTHDPTQFLRFSYVARGMYAAQLRAWMAQFPAERFFVLDSGELYADPGAAYQQILRFLGVRPWAPRHLPNISARRDDAPAEALAPEVRAMLEATFASANEDLEELLGRTMGWSRSSGEADGGDPGRISRARPLGTTSAGDPPPGTPTGR